MVEIQDVWRCLFIVAMLRSIFFLLDFFYLSTRAGLPESYRYNRTSTFSNAVILFTKTAATVLLAVPFGMLARYWYPHSLRLIPSHPGRIWGVLRAFLIVDLGYYVWHRISHNSRFFWFGHQIHHQDTHFNFSTSERGGVVEYLQIMSFMIVCMGAIFAVTGTGFSGLWMVLFMIIIGLGGFLHSSIGRLPKFFEFIFNTPSDHRMHHQLGPMAGRCNYGGLLIIWDRLFGTYREETRLVAGFGVSNVALDFLPVTHQFVGLISIEKFELGRKIEDIFSKCELFLISLSLACFFVPLYELVYAYSILALVLALMLELYGSLKGNQKVLFWIFDLMASGAALQKTIQMLRLGEAPADAFFWCTLAAFALPFILVLSPSMADSGVPSREMSYTREQA